MVSSPNTSRQRYKELFNTKYLPNNNDPDYRAWVAQQIADWEASQIAKDQAKLDAAASNAVDGKVYVYTNKTGGGLDDPQNYSIMTLEQFANVSDPSAYRFYNPEDYASHVYNAEADVLEQRQAEKEAALKEEYGISQDTEIIYNDALYQSLVRDPDSKTLVNTGEGVGVFDASKEDTALYINRQTYSPLLDTAVDKEISSSMESKPIFGIDNISPISNSSGDIIGTRDTFSGTTTMLPQSIKKVGSGYQDPFVQQSYSSDILLRNTLGQVSTQPTAIYNKTGQKIGVFDPIGKTSYDLMPRPKPIPNEFGAGMINVADKKSWKEILFDPGDYLIERADRAEQIYQHAQVRGDTNLYGAKAFGYAAAGTFINLFRHTIRTGRETLFEFPKALITSPSETSYGIGEQIRTTPLQFIGTQAGFVVAGGLVGAGLKKFEAMKTYELNIPYSDYARVRGKGGVNPTLVQAEKLLVNAPETSPVKVQRGGTMTSYIEIGGKQILKKTISEDVGLVQVGDTAYLNIPRQKFQAQVYSSNVGKNPLTVSVGRQPIESLRSVSRATSETPKQLLQGREVLGLTMPSGSVEIQTSGKVNKKITYPENYATDFNTRIGTQERYASVIDTTGKKTSGKRTQTESLRISTEQVINTRALATPGIVEKKGYVGGELKAVATEIKPTRFVFDENFKYQKNQLYAETQGDIQLLGKVKASSLKQIQRGDIYTQGEIKVIDAPESKAAKTPKISGRWKDILKRAEKSDREASLSNIEITGYMKEKLIKKQVQESIVSVTGEPAKVKTTTRLNLPKLSSLFKPAKVGKVATGVSVAGLFSTSSKTYETIGTGTITRPKQSYNVVSGTDFKLSSKVSPRFDTRTNTDIKTSSLSKTRFNTQPLFNTKIATDTSPMFDTKIATDTSVISDTRTAIDLGIAPVSPGGKIPSIPPPPIIPPPGFDFDWNYGKQRKSSRKNLDVGFSGKYVSSIEANVFNIKGNKNTLATKSGLGLRPL